MTSDLTSGTGTLGDAERAPVLIRCLRADDYEALSELVAAVVKARNTASLGVAVSAQPVSEPELTPGAVAAYVADGCCLVAAEDEQVVGYLLARPLAYLDERPLSVWVDGIAVHPARRRRGIALALYHHFGVRARTTGVRAALTRVAPDNRIAVALHHQVGFEPHANDALIWRLDKE